MLIMHCRQQGRMISNNDIELTLRNVPSANLIRTNASLSAASRNSNNSAKLRFSLFAIAADCSLVWRIVSTSSLRRSILASISRTVSACFRYSWYSDESPLYKSNSLQSSPTARGVPKSSCNAALTVGGQLFGVKRSVVMIHNSLS